MLEKLKLLVDKFLTPKADVIRVPLLREHHDTIRIYLPYLALFHMLSGKPVPNEGYLKKRVSAYKGKEWLLFVEALTRYPSHYKGLKRKMAKPKKTASDYIYGCEKKLSAQLGMSCCAI
ncbi:hypothetical protein AGMMS49949_04490 [Alphaproteobacteria bacterium]|nr:hypothetical protein AGMMS49949_04490 [Alphaproteobacteria bacterium]GHS96844.1 hypothetical protein AGMMS50296_3340 [Alphaproteobacteria bacterium]